MTEKSIAQFQEGIQADEELRKMLVQVIRTHQPDMTLPLTPAVFDAVVAFAAEQGYAVTRAEIETAYKALVEAQMADPERELSALELDMVAGGNSAGWMSITGPLPAPGCTIMH